MSDRLSDLENEISELKSLLQALEKRTKEMEDCTKRASIMVFSNDFDKLMMAFSMACCAASMGIKVYMFFTFWGISALRKNTTTVKSNSKLARMMSWMLPADINQTKLSKFNMFGLGTWMMKLIMKQNNTKTLMELRDTAKKLNVTMVACTPSLQLMGIDSADLIEDLEYCGCATFLLESSRSHITWMV